MRPNYQRLSAGELFGRAVLATVAGGMMTVGAYPYLPAILQARARRRPLLARLTRLDLPIEWSLAIASTLARPLGFAGLPGAGVRGRRPIVLAHGYAMGRSCFAPMAARLAANGLGPVVGFEYWTLGSISESAQRLRRVVERVLATTGYSDVDIIGHSMGGIVSRYYMSLEDRGRRVRRLITLGSPHRGAEVSIFGVGQMRREMSPGSATLTRLATSEIPEASAMTLVYSPTDVLAGGKRHTDIHGAEIVKFDNLGHMALLTDPAVFEVIRERLVR